MSDPVAVSRRLVAVFAADVEGYSRLMGVDEVGTLKGLTERRTILDKLIGDHRGRIANTAGDSFAHLGRDAEAREAAARVLEHDPAFTISTYIARGGSSNAKLSIEGLRKAGLPE